MARRSQRVLVLWTTLRQTTRNENCSFCICNRDNNFTHDFDIVIGPIANDGVAYLLGRYEEGTLTIEELSDKLDYKKLNSQYFFGTDKSLKYLKRI